MREESNKPRNSREMAVRNQFFTPEYIVRFLTDNSLGRIWYEMTKGQSRIGEEKCHYMVRRPDETIEERAIKSRPRFSLSILHVAPCTLASISTRCMSISIWMLGTTILSC